MENGQGLTRLIGVHDLTTRYLSGMKGAVEQESSVQLAPAVLLY
jgi:hypothetical protein